MPATIASERFEAKQCFITRLNTPQKGQVLIFPRYLRDSTDPYGLGAVMESKVEGATCTACCTRR